MLAKREGRLSLTTVLHLKSVKYAGGLEILEDFKGIEDGRVEGMIGWIRLREIRR